MSATSETKAGSVRPVVDPRRCEGKTDCAQVCPYDVFDIRALTDAERRALPLLSRVKLAVHGGRQAFVARPDQCQACGLCVKACPEHAIRLLRA